MRLTIRELAEGRGIKNAKALGDAINLSYKSSYAIWNGTATRIDLATMDKLCKLLRAQPGWLFEYDPNKEQGV